MTFGLAVVNWKENGQKFNELLQIIWITVDIQSARRADFAKYVGQFNFVRALISASRLLDCQRIRSWFFFDFDVRISRNFSAIFEPFSRRFWESAAFDSQSDIFAFFDTSIFQSLC